MLKRNAKTSESGAEQEDGPEDENEGEYEGEHDGDQEVEDQPEVKSEVNQPKDSSTKPEMKFEVDSKSEKHSKITVPSAEVNETKSEPSPEVETESVNKPEVNLGIQSPPEVAFQSEDRSEMATSSSLGEAYKITESDKIQNMEEKTEKPFEPKMENGIETINIHQIDRQKNEIEVNANSKIDVNVNDDKNGQTDGVASGHQNELSEYKEPEVESGPAEGSNEAESRRSRRAAARDKYGLELREVFKKVDKDGSGYASIDEMW